MFTSFKAIAAAALCALSAASWATTVAKPVVVAVIDSGVIAQHPSLQGKLLPGADVVSGAINVRGGRSLDATPDDRDTLCKGRVAQGNFRTHGTEVASLIVGNGQQGVSGVARNAKVVPIRVMGACGMNRQDMIDAILWAAGEPVNGLTLNPNPAKVINLSISGGGAQCSRGLQAVINQLVEKNVFVVAAAGNSGGQTLREPANCEGVISVGALSKVNEVANYSAIDPRTVVYAPGGVAAAQSSRRQTGGLRVATFELSGFGAERASAANRGVGTSYAAPLVSGYIAEMLHVQPNLTPKAFVSYVQHQGLPVAQKPCAECEPRRLASLDNWAQ